MTEKGSREGDYFCTTHIFFNLIDVFCFDLLITLK